MTARQIKLSEAQAKRVATIWADDKKILHAPDGFQEPTTVALIKRGVLARNGEKGRYPNGMEFDVYVLAPDATDHLAGYLLALRYKRVTP